MGKYLCVAIGGALGALARFTFATAVLRLYAGLFPLGTFLINVTGSFLIGVLMTLFLNRSTVHANWRLLLVTGILGGYTTFSSFEWEMVALLKEGANSTALFYVLGSIVLGLAAAWMGMTLGEKIWPQ